jgi:hypothetical protein
MLTHPWAHGSSSSAHPAKRPFVSGAVKVVIVFATEPMNMYAQVPFGRMLGKRARVMGLPLK